MDFQLKWDESKKWSSIWVRISLLGPLMASVVHAVLLGTHYQKIQNCEYIYIPEYFDVLFRLPVCQKISVNS